MNSRGTRHRVPQRTRIFLGCEGESEQSYGALLQRLADAAQLHLHIDAVPLHGGDPLAVVRAAAGKMRERAAKHGRYKVRAVLLDHDRIGLAPDRDAAINTTAANLLLIWQRPCHEALLLRHMHGHGSRRPATCDEAHRALHAIWPDYAKPMPAAQLATRIEHEHVRRAATVEPDLASFLGKLGMM